MAWRQRAEQIMTRGDPGDRAFSSPFEWLLYAASKIYESVVRLRIDLYARDILKQKRLPCKVLSVGNLTAGGTGKTPMACYVAEFLKGLNRKVAVISRGYGGSAQGPGGIVSDGRATLMSVEESGDEPQLLSSKLKGIPLVVGKDRYQSGMRAIGRFGAGILVMDDGFQHLGLSRDLNLLLLDSRRPFGNGYCLPRGVLREPADGINRAHALILTRWTETEGALCRRHLIALRAQGRPVFRCRHEPDGLFCATGGEVIDVRTIRGKRLFLFSGIARNDSFHESVARLGGEILGVMAFEDHHRYTEKDLRRIWCAAKRLRAEKVVTTEKDSVNISDEMPSSPELWVLRVAISFGEDTAAFHDYLKSWVNSRPAI